MPEWQFFIGDNCIEVKPATDEELSEHAPGNDESCWGCYYTDASGNHIILFSQALSGAKLNAVLLHELCHAWLSHTGISDLLNDKIEEFVCCQFALAAGDLTEFSKFVTKNWEKFDG